MGISIWHILVVVAVIMLLFGKGKIAPFMEDLGKGISSFKKGLKNSDDAPKSVEDKTKE